jgi:transcriptional regulator with XRE-family HTH domain
MKAKSSVQAIASYPGVVGAVLAAMRKEKELAQSDVAAAIGATVSTWSRIESGESALTIEQLAVAATELQVEPSAILRRADEKVAELRSKGIETKASRSSVEAIVSSGAVPLVGASLLAVLGPVGALATGAAIAGFHFYAESKKGKR